MIHCPLNPPLHTSRGLFLFVYEENNSTSLPVSFKAHHSILIPAATLWEEDVSLISHAQSLFSLVADLSLQVSGM